MKRISFFLALALIIASFGMASANSISLETISGDVWDDAGTTRVQPGGSVVFDLRLTNTSGLKIGGIANGFVVSADSGPFTPMSLTADPTFAGGWDLGFFVNNFSVDGAGADTIGVGAAIISGTGMAIGYDAVTYSITTGGLDSGATLCLDSAFFPPSGTWKWASGATNIFPSWDGPHCITAVLAPCLPPTVNNAPLSLSGSHCDPIQFDFNADAGSEGGTIGWSADIGSIDANGVWTYTPTLADVGASMSVTVTATDQCSSDATVNLTFTNEAPVMTCPGTQSVSTGADNTATVTTTDDCNSGISFSIVDDGTIGATIDPNTGVVSFNATTAGLFTIIVSASDGNATSECSFDVNAVAGSLFQVEIPCVGDQSGNFVFQGQHVSVPVNLITDNVIGGYDLLVAYDNSALSFQSADPGADILAEGWEYFTYRYGANGNCSNACPSGLLRLTAIAETSNGPNHPSNGGVTELAVLDFLVTNDRTFECQEIPIRFFWMDCGDNTLSDWTGNELHISEVVFDGDESLFPPNGNEIQNPNYGYPTYFGAQNEDCFTDPLKQPIADVSFNNGCVFIACADSIDARGDLNLNSVSNEIADAVLYSNYFIYGIGVFTVNTEGQIAASDVNADGLSLSVADLVYIIRIIVGDALPYPKLAPVNATIVENNGTLNVDAEMGAALVVIEGNVTAELIANDMTIETAFDGVNTRVLVYSLEGNTFSGDFLNVNGDIVSVELGSADGATVNAKIIPANFELAQNYPNPFNPSTTIGFSVPVQSDVTLTVYNVTGQKVAEFSGSYGAGVHTIEWDASMMASGIYFYRLNAGDFAATNKMVLLK